MFVKRSCATMVDTHPRGLKGVANCRDFAMSVSISEDLKSLVVAALLRPDMFFTFL